MPELNFPSGAWTGFYNYGGGASRHRMDLFLDFSSGRISGDGVDGVGQFVIAGSYDGDSGECHWVKTYVGAHDVFYRGFREGKGIWGTWELTGGSGGFQIWPLGADDKEEVAEYTEQERPAEIVSIERHDGRRHLIG